MPLNVIQAPTNISGTGNVFLGAQITRLSSGGYALTYSDGGGAAWATFDALGAPGPSGDVQFTFDPDIAALSGGGFALAWEEPQSSEIYTAVYDAQGAQVVAPFPVSSTPGTDIFVTVTALANDAYALTWSNQATVGNYDIYTAVYNAQGGQVAPPLNVSATPNVEDQRPVVTALSGGGYALIWTSLGNIFTAVYDAQGLPTAAPRNVSNTGITTEGGAMQVTALANGGFALIWQEQLGFGSNQIVTAVYDALGQQVAAPVMVASGIQPQIARCRAETTRCSGATSLMYSRRSTPPRASRCRRPPTSAIPPPARTTRRRSRRCRTAPTR
jgi:hypothetical protein